MSMGRTRWDCAPSAGCDRQCSHKSNSERESRASLAAWRGRLFLRVARKEPGWSESGHPRRFGQSLPIRSEGQHSRACACWAHARIATASTRVRAPCVPLDDVPAGSLLSSSGRSRHSCVFHIGYTHQQGRSQSQHIAPHLTMQRLLLEEGLKGIRAESARDCYHKEVKRARSVSFR